MAPFFLFVTFGPRNADFGAKFGDILKILEIGPKFNFRSGAFFENFTNDGDGWRNVPPAAAPYY